MSTESFDQLMARLRKGDQDAAREIFERYVQRLAGMVRNRLSARMRQKVDPEDVTQSAFRTFFRRLKNNEFTFAGWDSVWAVLTLITLRKCGHQVEHFQAACRDVHREVPAGAVSQDSGASWLQIARDPTPDEEAMLGETVEQLLERLRERERQVFLLSLQGYTAAEISACLGRAERTIHRVLGHVKKELERLRDEDRHVFGATLMP